MRNTYLFHIFSEILPDGLSGTPGIQLAGIFLLLGGLLSSCQSSGNQKQTPAEFSMEALIQSSGLTEADFDTTLNGQPIGLYWIQNDSILAAFTNYGARIIGLWVPNNDTTGLSELSGWTDVVVGMGSIADYLKSTERYFGATIGRVGNRIAKGRFTLEGTEYQIPVNNGENALHGGVNGFQDVVWNVSQPDPATLVFTYRSPDGEEGFPGHLDVQVTYSVNDKRAILMEYEATTDQTTIVNLTNHAFFNLNGEGSGPILDHQVTFFADQFTPVDEGLIPTGEWRDVQETPFDFTLEHTIGERINTANTQLEYGGGYDHNFILNGLKAHGMNYAAHIIGDKSGIVMDVYTQEPGMQFYSGNFMQGNNTFKSGARDEYRTAFALETQHFPDAPNHPDFPSIVLKPGDTYQTVSEYQFSVIGQR